MPADYGYTPSGQPDIFGDQDPFSQPFIQDAAAQGQLGVQDALVAPVDPAEGIGEISAQEQIDSLLVQEQAEQVSPNDYTSMRSTMGMALPYIAAMLSAKKQSDLNAALQGFVAANQTAQVQAMRRAQFENDQISKRYKERIQSVRDERTNQIVDARMDKQGELNREQATHEAKLREEWGMTEQQFEMTKLFASDHLERERLDDQWEKSTQHDKDMAKFNLDKQLEIIKTQYGYDKRLQASAAKLGNNDGILKMITSMANQRIAQMEDPEQAFAQSAALVVPMMTGLATYDPKDPDSNQHLSALLGPESKAQIDVSHALATMNIVRDPKLVKGEFDDQMAMHKKAGKSDARALEDSVRTTVNIMRSQKANNAEIAEALKEAIPELADSAEGQELIRRYTRETLMQSTMKLFGGQLSSGAIGDQGGDFINPGGSPLSRNF